MVSEQVCHACAAQVISCDGVFLTGDEEMTFLCSRCYNERIANYLGLDYEHFSFEPVTLEDCDGIPRTFRFRTHLFGDQLSLAALEMVGTEIIDEFSVIAAAEQDLFVTFTALFERLRRELGRKHIEQTGTDYRITDGGVVRGQITSDPDAFDGLPLLIVDGRPFDWEAFGRLLEPYEGFRFKLEIFDRSEER